MGDAGRVLGTERLRGDGDDLCLASLESLPCPSTPSELPSLAAETMDAHRVLEHNALPWSPPGGGVPQARRRRPALQRRRWRVRRVCWRPEPGNAAGGSAETAVLSLCWSSAFTPSPVSASASLSPCMLMTVLSNLSSGGRVSVRRPERAGGDQIRGVRPFRAAGRRRTARDRAGRDHRQTLRVRCAVGPSCGRGCGGRAGGAALISQPCQGQRVIGSSLIVLARHGIPSFIVAFGTHCGLCRPHPQRILHVRDSPD